jgi:hypothetical protein
MSRGSSMGNKDLLALRDRDFGIEVGQHFVAGPFDAKESLARSQGFGGRKS